MYRICLDIESFLVVTQNLSHKIKRLHCSRMRTARTLTVSPSTLCSGGLYLVLGVYLVPGVYLLLGGTLSPGGCLFHGGCLLGGCLLQGGVPGPRGVYLVLGGLLQGVLLQGGSALGGCTWSQGGVPGQALSSPPVDRMTHASENITLPQTSFAGGKKFALKPHRVENKTKNCPAKM